MKNRPTSEQFREQLTSMVEWIRSEIRNGAYAEGGRLPSEKELAAKYGLSNNSIRKGLELLVEEGLIEKIPRVGNRVIAVDTGRAPVTLTLGCNRMIMRNLELDVLLDDIHRRYPWITVKTKLYNDMSIVDDREDTQSCDLIMLDNIQFQRMIEAGKADQFKTLAIKEDFYPKLTQLFAFEDSYRMQPVIFSPIVLCYNKAHFRECGLQEPDGAWTWNEMMRCAERLSDGKGRYGFGIHIQDMNRWPIFLLQSGERFEREGERLKELRGSKMLESLRLCKSIVHSRKATPLFLSENNSDTLQMFMEGKLSMVIHSYTGLNKWKYTDLEYDVSPIPFIHEPRTLVIGIGVGVNARTEHVEEALLLLDYFGSARASKLIAEHTLSIPALRPFPAPSSDNGIRRPERYAQYREMMFSYRTHGDLNIPVAAFPKLFQPLKSYWADMIDENELCDRIDKALTEDRTQPWLRGE